MAIVGPKFHGISFCHCGPLIGDCVDYRRPRELGAQVIDQTAQCTTRHAANNQGSCIGYCPAMSHRAHETVPLAPPQMRPFHLLPPLVTHPARQDCLGQACTRAGHAAQRAEDGKVRAFRRFGDAGQYEFVPFALESYGRLGASGQSFLKRLGDIAAGRGNISKSTFVRSAYKEVSCALRGIGLMYARSTLNIARASGRQFMPGCAIPVQEEAYL